MCGAYNPVVVQKGHASLIPCGHGTKVSCTKTQLNGRASLWHAFCTFIQDVRGRYKMSESETRFEKFSVNMKNWTQHEKLDATWKK